MEGAEPISRDEGRKVGRWEVSIRDKLGGVEGGEDFIHSVGGWGKFTRLFNYWEEFIWNV